MNYWQRRALLPSSLGGWAVLTSFIFPPVGLLLTLIGFDQHAKDKTKPLVPFIAPAIILSLLTLAIIITIAVLVPNANKQSTTEIVLMVLGNR